MSPSKESYDPHYFEPLFAAEEKHFWFVARNKVISSLRESPGRYHKPAILEVGCGTGNVLQSLEKEFPSANRPEWIFFRRACGLPAKEHNAD
jgi:tRNA G46 methylase TrmB